MFFFFQAEDGIRDIGVTGVQTCALPICFDEDDRVRHAGVCASPGARMSTVASVACSTSALKASASVSIGGEGSGSEERRGGEEGGFRRAADHLKKKITTNPVHFGQHRLY